MLWLLRLIVFRRFRDGKLRTLLTVAGIAVGVASLIATGAANEAVIKGFKSTLNAIGGEADISITSALNGDVSETLPDRIAKVPGVESVSPAITEVAKLPDGTQLYVFGVDFAAGDETRGFNAFGSGSEMPDAMSFLNDPEAVLVTKRFAASHGLKIDDRFPIVTTDGPKQFHVRGLLDEQGAAKAFGGVVHDGTSLSINSLSASCSSFSSKCTGFPSRAAQLSCVPRRPSREIASTTDFIP